MTIKKGDIVRTPRFCTVTINEVFADRRQAFDAGYTEPTYVESDEYDVRGRSIDMYHMEFAAYRRAN